MNFIFCYTFWQSQLPDHTILIHRENFVCKKLLSQIKNPATLENAGNGDNCFKWECVEWRYQGKCNVNMIADFCWMLKRECVKDSKKRKKQTIVKYLLVMRVWMYRIMRLRGYRLMGFWVYYMKFTHHCKSQEKHTRDFSILKYMTFSILHTHTHTNFLCGPVLSIIFNNYIAYITVASLSEQLNKLFQLT